MEPTNRGSRHLNLGTDRYSDFVPLGTEGAGGEVFRARDAQAPPGLSQWVVIKRPKWDQSESGDLQQQLIEKEIRALRLLQDVSGVCRLRDTGEATYLVNQGRSSIPYTYLVMEFARGEDVRCTVERAVEQETSLPPGFYLRVLLSFAGILAEAHRRGVTYNDFKPEHLIVEGAGRLTVIDWGMADFLSTAGQKGGAGNQPSPTERDKARVRDEIRKFADLVFFVLTGDSADTRRQRSSDGKTGTDGLLRAVRDPGMRQLLRHIYQPEPAGSRIGQMEDVVAALRNRLQALETKLAPYSNQIEALLDRRSSSASVKTVEFLMDRVKEVDPGSPHLAVWAERLHVKRHEKDLQDQFVLWQLYVGTQDWQSAARACEQGLALIPQWELGRALLTMTGALSSLSDAGGRDERLAAIRQALSKGDFNAALDQAVRLQPGEPGGERWQQIGQLCASLLAQASPPQPRLQRLVRNAVGLMATLKTAWSEDEAGATSLTRSQDRAQEISVIANAFRTLATELWGSHPPRLDRADVEGGYRQLEQRAEQLGYLLSETSGTIPKAVRPSVLALGEAARKIKAAAGAIGAQLGKIEAFGKDATFDQVSAALWEACTVDIDGYALRHLAWQFESQPTAFLPLPPPASDTPYGSEDSTWIMDDEEAGLLDLDGLGSIQQRLQHFGRTFEQILRMPKETMFDTEPQRPAEGDPQAEDDRTATSSVSPGLPSPLGNTDDGSPPSDRGDGARPWLSREHSRRRFEIGEGRMKKACRLLQDLIPVSPLAAEPTGDTDRLPSREHQTQSAGPSSPTSLVLVDGAQIGRAAPVPLERDHDQADGFFLADDGTLHIRQTDAVNGGEGLLVPLDAILAMQKTSRPVGRLVRLVATWEALALTEGALVGLQFSTSPTESFLLAVRARSATKGEVVLLDPQRRQVGGMAANGESVAMQGSHTFCLEYTFNDQVQRHQVSVYLDSATDETATVWAQPHHPQTGLVVQGDHVHVSVGRLEVAFGP